MEHFEQKISRETIFEGVVFNIHKDKVKLENEKIATRELVEHNGGVAVVAVDEENNIFMVKQFRYGVGEETWELPAGKIDKGEEPLDTGKRELEEEVGYTAKAFTSLGKMCVSPAYCSEQIYIYLAEGLTQTKQNLDQDEFLTIEKMPVTKVKEMCLDGRINDSKTIVGITRYLGTKNE